MYGSFRSKTFCIKGFRVVAVTSRSKSLRAIEEGLLYTRPREALDRSKSGCIRIFS